MFKIGLTGQTGAGKTTFARYLEKYGFEHIDTDKTAREIIPETLDRLTEEFGNDILFSDGTLNRKALAKKAFSSEEKTRALNSITHPVIMKKVFEQINEAEKRGARGVVIDGAALIESGAMKDFDTSVCVVADRAIRKKRIRERDKLSEDEAETRLRGQKDESFYISNTEHKIVNNTAAEFEEQADRLMKEYNFYPAKEEK